MLILSDRYPQELKHFLLQVGKFRIARSRKLKLQLCRDQTNGADRSESIAEIVNQSPEPEKAPAKTWAPCPVCGCKRMCVIREIHKPQPGGHLAIAA